MREVKNQRHITGSMFVDKKNSCNHCKSVYSLKTYIWLWSQKYVYWR